MKLEHNISNDLTVFIEPKTIEVTIEERASEEFAVVADFINEDKMAPGYELVDYTLDPPTVTITSSRSVIDQIGIVKAYVNLEGLDSSINNRELPVNVYDTQGNELTVRIEPENIQISAEVDNPSKSVPVSVETTGELPEGYALNSISANVDEVEVFSTSEVLEGISELETEAIDLSEITESGTIDAQLSLPEGVNVPDMETIEVTVDVEQTRVLEGLTIEEEGLTSGQAVTFVEPDAAEMDITVTGDEADIKELTAEDIRIFIDLSDLEPGEHQVPITIEGPDTDNITITGEFEEATIEISEVEPE